MNNHFSGFAGQILSNSRNIPKMIKGRLANISNMCFKGHSIIRLLKVVDTVVKIQTNTEKRGAKGVGSGKNL